MRFASKLAIVSCAIAYSSVATADPSVDQVKAKMNAGMEHYDLADFTDARNSLNEAIALAKKNGIDGEPIAGDVYLRLGIVYFAQSKPDKEAAKVAFINALKINPTIQIPKIYVREDMSAMLEKLRAEQSGSTVTETSKCRSVKGFVHAPVDEAFVGRKLLVNADVSDKIKAKEVKLHYRPQGQSDYSVVPMAVVDGCTWAGFIPGKYIKGTMLQYYIAAYDGSGNLIAQKGSSGVPNPVSLEIPEDGDVPGDTDPTDEDPFDLQNKKKKKEKKNKKKKRRDGPTAWYLGFGVGTGGGFVTGKTESLQEEITPGFAPAWLSISPEFGYHLSEKFAIALTGRLGFTIGATVPGHSTLAPAGILRGRYTTGGESGFQVNAGIGGGFTRQVLAANPQGEKDTAVSGPLLVVAGFGYQKKLTESLRFLADINAIAGIPVVKEMGTVRPHFGTQVDINLGIFFTF